MHRMRVREYLAAIVPFGRGYEISRLHARLRNVLSGFYYTVEHIAYGISSREIPVSGFIRLQLPGMPQAIAKKESCLIRRIIGHRLFHTLCSFLFSNERIRKKHDASDCLRACNILWIALTLQRILRSRNVRQFIQNHSPQYNQSMRRTPVPVNALYRPPHKQPELANDPKQAIMNGSI